MPEALQTAQDILVLLVLPTPATVVPRSKGKLALGPFYNSLTQRHYSPLWETELPGLEGREASSAKPLPVSRLTAPPAGLKRHLAGDLAQVYRNPPSASPMAHLWSRAQDSLSQEWSCRYASLQHRSPRSGGRSFWRLTQCSSRSRSRSWCWLSSMRLRLLEGRG